MTLRGAGPETCLTNEQHEESINFRHSFFRELVKCCFSSKAMYIKTVSMGWTSSFAEGSTVAPEGILRRIFAFPRYQTGSQQRIVVSVYHVMNEQDVPSFLSRSICMEKEELEVPTNPIGAQAAN